MSSMHKAMAALQAAKNEKQNQQTKSESSNTPSLAQPAKPEPQAQKEQPAHSPKTELKPEFLDILNKNETPKKPQTAVVSGLTTEQKPTITRVDLSIAGTPHRISCPSNEVANLNKTADTLNKNLKELRGALGKNPSNEELLVLHCLELYDQIQELQAWQDKAKEQSAKEQAFLDKLLKDASAIA